MGRPTVLPVVVVSVVLLGLYVAFISSTTWLELVVGSVVAVGAAWVGGYAVRVLGLRVSAPRLRWRWLWSFPVDACWDAVRLAARLVGLSRTRREGRGWWDEVALPQGVGEPEVMRAYAVLVVSLTPASYVADVHVDVDDPADVGRLRVRRWARKGPIERAITP